MYWIVDFYSICKLFTVEMRQSWKQLQSSVAETIASFLLSESFLIYTFRFYSSLLAFFFFCRNVCIGVR
jgi:hypothetical protein